MMVMKLVLATVTLQIMECGGGTVVERLLWTLQGTVQQRAAAQRSSQGTSSQHSALTHFKSFSCTSREDGLYPDLVSRCSLYYRCLDGAVYSYACSSGETLDYKLGECRPARDVACPRLPPSTPPCVNQSDGFYPDYSRSCTYYYRCLNGSLAGRWGCDDGATWDLQTGSCGRGSQLACSAPACWGLADGPHPTPSSSCTAYFTCTNGVRTDHVCPYDTLFDYSLKRCVSSSSSVCYERACEGRVNGLHAAARAPCNSFFRCFNGALVEHHQCPLHQVFDGESCVPASNFSCWGEARGSCEGHEDGFHVAQDSDCRGFFLCRHHQVIRGFLCSPGLVFNGKECVKDPNTICTSRPRVLDCSNKIDGYYTVEKTECKTFFFCRGGSKMSEHTCPGNNVFNGEHCVDPVLYPCPGRHGTTQHTRIIRSPGISLNHNDDDDDDDGGICSSRPNGYYVDITSKCSQYFSCKSGLREFTMNCPPGELFNGRKCISSKEYKCPVLPYDLDCVLRGDGIYQDLQDSCRSYFQCTKGARIQHKCLEGELHNGDRCQEASQVYCPTASFCQQRRNGLFADVNNSCKGYFHCYEGSLLYYQMCEKGKVHNGQMCVANSSHTCPVHLNNDCHVKPDGTYPDTSTQCRQYYRCAGGFKVALNKCGDEQLYNGKMCVAAKSFTCPVYDQEIDKCPPGVKIYLQDLHSGCNRYYYCHYGQKLPQRCTDGHVFNGKQCVLHSEYHCPLSYPVVPPDNSACQGPGELFPDTNTDCRTYYQCLGGYHTKYICPNEQVFNGFKCVENDQFTCPKELTCRGKINGLYQDIHSGCHRYFNCHKGHKTEYTCPMDQVYNGQMCVPTLSYTCPSLSQDLQCTEKSTGFYPDPSSGCQKYFMCQNGVKVQTLICPNKQVFNGNFCVPPSDFTCSAHSDKNKMNVILTDPLRLGAMISPDNTLTSVNGHYGINTYNAKAVVSRKDSPAI